MIGLVDIFIFILGLIIGSFLNVVIYRYNTGFTLNGRSQCLACGNTLRWYELVPLFSYLFQLGRCRHCGSGISLQYPLVELATGLLFWGIWLQHLPPLQTILVAVIWSLLVVIAVYDLRHTIIPDGLVAGFAAATLALLALRAWPVGGGEFNWPIVVDGVIAAAALASFFWFLWFVSQGRWMGFGDAKLAIGVGLLLGLWPGVTAIVLAFWIGAAVGLGLIAFTRLSHHFKFVTMKSEIPFAPFIILGTLLVFFFHLHVLTF